MQTDLVGRALRVLVMTILFGLALAGAAGAGTISLNSGAGNTSWTARDEAAITSSLHDTVSVVPIHGCDITAGELGNLFQKLWADDTARMLLDAILLEPTGGAISPSFS